MPRRIFHGAALAALLIACDHEEPFESPDAGTGAPFQPGAPARLTYNPGKDLHPAWLADGSAIIYAWEELALLPYDRCLGLMAQTGGTRYRTICDQSAAGEDSTDLFDEPSASSDGQLAFLRGRSRPGAVAPDWLGLEVGDLADVPTARKVRSIPYTAPSGRVHNRVSHIGWLTPTELVYLGELVVYPRPCSSCLPDTLISGLDIVRLDFSTATPLLQVVSGTDYASSVAVGEGDTIYFTLGGDSRVYRHSLSTTTIEVAHDFGPLGIARDVTVLGDRLVAVVGGEVSFVSDPIFGPVQHDEGGSLVSVDLTSGAETILPSVSPPLFRRPVFAPGSGTIRLVAEGHTFSSRIPDLYLFEAP
jgi:hypothetical protein